ncbi:hypothetical protein V495_00044 [Pseudogymnoascus sp. VKM F-4514 (FW-929)]|nr:hypothetical protein V495_00044 [Pseudogymnoascus sp. VKM F-4514 (FW-929)]KFY67963.1 hypothetical protein V497_00098 [Pseudogymnoascus sp. VKM F-4516 (FW-969)]
MPSANTQRDPWEPYYYATYDLRSKTVVSSKFEICIPDGEGSPERMAVPFVPSLHDLSVGPTLKSVLRSLRQHNQGIADLDQGITDLDHASHTYGDNGDRGNVTLLSMARNWLCCIGSKRKTSKADASTTFGDSRSLLVK